MESVTINAKPAEMTLPVIPVEVVSEEQWMKEQTVIVNLGIMMMDLISIVFNANILVLPVLILQLIVLIVDSNHLKEPQLLTVLVKQDYMSLDSNV